MYASFFGLSRPPFSIAPDPRSLFMSNRHREALAHLLYGVRGGGGFVLLTGEIGAGKTTVCRCFLEQVPDGCQVGYIFNPKLTVAELLQTVCDEFGIVVKPPVGGPTVKTYVDALNAHLLAAHAQGRQCLLIIDEAQHLAPDVLEQLRLLTNLETNERKLLQIILIGQPELRDMLAASGMEQLAQRVIARCHLDALNEVETAAYVAHRLVVAGLVRPMPFDAATLRRVFALTQGVPRRINLLCDRALLGAYAEGVTVVSRRILERAASEAFGLAPPARRRARWPWAVGAAAVALAAGSAAWWMWSPLVGGTGGAGGGLAGAALKPASVPAARPASAAASADVPAVAASDTVAVAARPASAQAAGLALPASGAGPSGPDRASSAALAKGPEPMLARPAEVPPLLPNPGLAVLSRDEQAVLGELAPLWGWQTPPGGASDLCQATRAEGLHCFRTSRGTLAQLAQLDRPSMLVLRAEQGPPQYARLVSINARRVVLAAGPLNYSLPVEMLAILWRGEFTTLWRAPDGYSQLLEPGARGVAVDVLARRLASLRNEPLPPSGQVLAGALAARLSAFQVANGLMTDGIAGPTVFMQLNRLQGMSEPHLRPDPVER